MRLVIDTNVVISALLKPSSVPARALDAALERAVILYDSRIEAEYRRVLAKPKFRTLDQTVATALCDRIVTVGTHVHAGAPFTGAMKDDDDRAFVEVALHGEADAIVTGNLADFPFGAGFEVLTPALLLDRLAY